MGTSQKVHFLRRVLLAGKNFKRVMLNIVFIIPDKGIMKKPDERAFVNVQRKVGFKFTNNLHPKFLAMTY
jgi:hypothetical protein